MTLLTKERQRNLQNLIQFLKSALKELFRDVPMDTEVMLKKLQHSAENTVIKVYDASVLEAEGSAVTLGSHEQPTFSFQGKDRTVNFTAAPVINMPIHHLFRGDKLTFSGTMTLIHEWAHFPKNNSALAEAFRMDPSKAEEFAADLLTARVGAKLGFSPRYIMQHFQGRSIVYGEHFSLVFNALGHTVNAEKHPLHALGQEPVPRPRPRKKARPKPKRKLF